MKRTIVSTSLDLIRVNTIRKTDKTDKAAAEGHHFVFWKRL